MRRLSILLALGFLVLEADAVRAEDHPCQDAIEHALSGHGISLSEVKVLGWKTDHFADEGGGDGPVDGYRFYGRPPACQDGEISIELGKHCGVEDVFTHGDCRIEGIPHIWW